MISTWRGVVLGLVFGLAASTLGATPSFAGDVSPQANQAFLAANATKPGVVIRPSGLQYRVIKAGTGAKSPTTTDVVSVVYKGQMIDGYVFDRTKPGQTSKFPVDKVIPGWTEALMLMKPGDQWELVIPSNLGYADRGSPDGFIPSNQTLVFEVELLSIETAAQ